MILDYMNVDLRSVRALKGATYDSIGCSPMNFEYMIVDYMIVDYMV